MYPYLPWVALALLACAAALWKVVPRSHKRFRAALGFLGMWLVVWAGIGGAGLLRMNPAAARQVAVALVGLAVVQVIAGAVLDLAVERARVPRFAAEMVVVACYLLIVVNCFTASASMLPVYSPLRR